MGIEHAPEEACGILVPEHADRPLWAVHQLKNRASDTMRGYEIDPTTIADLELSPDVWDEVRIWHTHPNGMVGPSEKDIAYARPGLKYVVITVPTGEFREFTSDGPT